MGRENWGLAFTPMLWGAAFPGSDGRTTAAGKVRLGDRDFQCLPFGLARGSDACSLLVVDQVVYVVGARDADTTNCRAQRSNRSTRCFPE